MPDWAFASASSGAVTAAVWATIASLAASVLLLLYTLELRFRRRQRERQRASVVARWRSVIAAAVTGADAGGTAPALPRRERGEFLKLWNTTRNMIEGAAAERLIVLAQQLGLPELVRKQVQNKQTGRRLIAIQTLGHLRDRESFARVQAEVEDDNPLMSIAAADALIEIDAIRAVDALIPKIASRRDWPRTHVFRMLQKAGSDLVGEPLFRCIRTADDADATYLLQYVELAEFDVRDAICSEVLHSRTDPELIAAALKAASGHSSMPRIDEFVAHPAWYIRMQAARLIGRMGHAEDRGRLEKLLGDPEWWVRYRAATALVRLPTLSRAELEQIRDRQSDAYARDILGQAIGEAGANR